VPYRIHHAVGHDLVGGPGEEIDPGGGEPLEVVDPPLGGGIPRRRERLCGQVDRRGLSVPDEFSLNVPIENSLIGV
jgi:hypothetical protein